LTARTALAGGAAGLASCEWAVKAVTVIDAVNKMEANNFMGDVVSGEKNRVHSTMQLRVYSL
jgi:hypothetical protein